MLWRVGICFGTFATLAASFIAVPPPILPRGRDHSSSRILLFSSSSTTSTPFVTDYQTLSIPTTNDGPPRQEIVVTDLTSHLQELVRDRGVLQGTLTVISQHTTTSICINEKETRLFRDMAVTLKQLIPPDERSYNGTTGVRYQHNDIEQRPEDEDERERCQTNGWDMDSQVGRQAWRDQEPINAHSHLLSMLLGSSESIPIVDGALQIGQWQSVLLVDLDGPRDRRVGVQILGTVT